MGGCRTIARLWCAPVNEMKGPSPSRGKTPNIGADAQAVRQHISSPRSSWRPCLSDWRTRRNLRHPPAPAPSELQTQVEALLESGPFEIHGAHIAYPSVIYAFYAQRGFQPAWANERTASELRRALKDSEADGLDPRDYHLPVLEELASRAAAMHGAAYEILHTDALLRIADHLLFGKVDAAIVRRALELHAQPYRHRHPATNRARPRERRHLCRDRKTETDASQCICP